MNVPTFHIVLVRPEIPQNTGSIARLVAATRARLHLVGPLGFSLEDRYLKRAGLDYWPLVDLRTYAGWDDFAAIENHPGRRQAPQGRERHGSSVENTGVRVANVTDETVGLRDSERPRFRYFSARAAGSYLEADYAPGDFLVFGSETKGLGAEFLSTRLDTTYRIPIFEPGVRSLNLANAVSIVLYEALRRTVLLIE